VYRLASDSTSPTSTLASLYTTGEWKWRRNNVMPRCNRILGIVSKKFNDIHTFTIIYALGFAADSESPLEHIVNKKVTSALALIQHPFSIIPNVANDTFQMYPMIVPTNDQVGSFRAIQRPTTKCFRFIQGALVTVIRARCSLSPLPR
jgi:hypothetical protein